MKQTKRERDFKESSSFDGDAEKSKLQKTMDYQHIPITSFEELANEIVFEIFESLHGDDIYKAFSNLNSRFERLISCPSLLLKIRLHENTHLDVKSFYESVIKNNEHRIISLGYGNATIVNDFFNDYSLDSSFVRLQSITINEISMRKSREILSCFKALPCLSSLTITLHQKRTNGLPKLYRQIFSLSFLKYTKLSFFKEISDDDSVIHVPFTKNDQLSPIEYLTIDHECTDAGIFSILRHTPQIQRLTCGKYMTLQQFALKPPLVLPKLKYIYMNNFSSDMIDLKLFIRKLSTPLEVFVLIDLSDRSYLDAKQWERFILKRMPLLRRLEFTCDLRHELDANFILSAKMTNEFLSPFWAERQNFFAVAYDGNFKDYSLRSYRDMYLDIYKRTDIAKICNGNIDHSSTEMMKLHMIVHASKDLFQPFFDKLKSDIEGMRFTRLAIFCPGISNKALEQIIQLLPNLNSLKILSTFQVELDSLLDNNEENRSLTSMNNKITTVNFVDIRDLHQIDFIFILCRRLQYLQVDIALHAIAPIFLAGILRKATSSTYNPDLNTLCFDIRNASERLVDQIDKYIKCKKLLNNYIIRRFNNYILLKWN